MSVSVYQSKAQLLPLSLQCLIYSQILPMKLSLESLLFATLQMGSKAQMFLKHIEFRI